MQKVTQHLEWVRRHMTDSCRVVCGHSDLARGTMEPRAHFRTRC